MLILWQLIRSGLAVIDVPRLGYSGFQVTGMIKGILGGLKFLILGFFRVEKFGKYFFGWLDLSRVFLGIQNDLKILDRPSYRSRPCNVFIFRVI